MHKILTALWALILLLSCKDPEIPEVNMPCVWFCDTIPPTEIVWKSRVVDDPFIETVPMEPKLSDSIVLFSNKLYKDQPEIYKGYNRFSGNHLWSWQIPMGSYSSTSRDNYVVDDQLILSTATYYYNLNLLKGKENSNIRIQEFAQGPRIKVYDDKVYITMYSWPPSDTIAYLCSMDLRFSRVDTLAKHIRVEGEVEPSITLEPPSFWVRPDGDTIAVYVLRGYTVPNQNWYEIHALNLSEKTESGFQELWMRDSFPYDDNCNVVAEPIFYRDSLLIFPGQGAVYGIGLTTGELIYSTPIPEDLHTTDFILVEDQVVFVDNPGDLHILDPLTGEILAIIPDCGGNVSNMEAHDGIVYFTSTGDGKLYAVDLRREEVVWEWSSPHKAEQDFAQFTFAGVAIGQERGWLYTSDRVYAMCVELYVRE